MNKTRGDFATVAVQNYVFFAGDRYNNKRSVEIYNTQSKIWEEEITSPSDIWMPGSTAVLDELAVFVSGSYLMSYNITSKQWTLVNALRSQSTPSVTSCKEYVFIAPGAPYDRIPSLYVDIYNVKANNWTTVNFTSARYGVASASIADIAIFSGGSTFDGQAYVYNVTSHTWTMKTTPSRLSLQYPMVYPPYFVYFGGGTDGDGINTGKWSASVDVYDIRTGEFNNSVAFPGAPRDGRVAPSSQVIGHLGFVGSPSNMFIYNMINHTTTVEYISTNSRWNYVVSGRTLFVGGGVTFSGQTPTTNQLRIWEYDCLTNSDCDDHNPCTIDSCGYACVHTNITDCIPTFTSSSSSSSSTIITTTTTASSSELSSSSSSVMGTTTTTSSTVDTSITTPSPSSVNDDDNANNSAASPAVSFTQLEHICFILILCALSIRRQ